MRHREQLFLLETGEKLTDMFLWLIQSNVLLKNTVETTVKHEWQRRGHKYLFPGEITGN
jgi:hypothetical protein